MQAISFDQYRAGKSIIHCIDPRVKLLLTLLFIISNLILPDGGWIVFALVLACIIALSQMSSLGWGYVFKRSLIMIPFILAAVTIIFTLPGEAIAQFKLFSWELTISDAGLIRFASIFLRSWLSIQFAILLAATTPFPDIAHSLRHLYVPQIIVAIILFMYRYIFVLGEETQRLLRARAARSARIPGRKGGSVLWRAKVAGNMVGQLFVRSYERSERVYQAMLARGYQGEFLTVVPHHMHQKDWIAALIAVIAVGLIQAAAILL